MTRPPAPTPADREEQPARPCRHVAVHDREELVTAERDGAALTDDEEHDALEGQEHGQRDDEGRDAEAGDQDADAAATLQGQLIDMPGPPRWMHAVDHRNDPNYPLREGGEYTQYALLAHEQVPTDFLWQRSPVWSHGSQDAPYEFPGIDLFLPYWMGRAAGVLPAP